MLNRHAFCIIAVLLAAPLVLAQNTLVPPAAWVQPPVPPGSLELVTGDAQPVTDLAQRSELVAAMVEAQRHTNLRAQPYTVRSTFTVSGSGAEAGAWHEEDSSPSASLYRWTVQGPGYSLTNVNKGRVFFSSQNSVPVPLRLVEFRRALFPVLPAPRTSLRIAPAAYNGTALRCVLMSFDSRVAAEAGPRRWNEEELCFDPAASRVVAHSTVPGEYVFYDYAKNLQFHDRSIANGFTVSENDQPVIIAQIEAVTDPVNDPASFDTSALHPAGIGPVGGEPSRIQMVNAAGSVTSGANQVVLLHGLQYQGRLSELEPLASSDPSLYASALALASRWSRPGPPPSTDQITPQSREAFITIEYISQQNR